MPDAPSGPLLPTERARILAIGNAYPPHYLGGYEIIWQGVMHQLRAEGHAVRILTTDYRGAAPGSPGLEDPDVHRELGWYWRDHEWPRMAPRARLRLERHNAAVLDRHLAAFEPDVVTWWPVGGMSLGLIERVRRRELPSVFFVLDYWPIYGPRRDLWLKLWRSVPARARPRTAWGVATRVDLAGAGRWVFCSETVRDTVVSEWPEIHDLTVLAPGVEERLVRMPEAPRAGAWSWRLLYVGRVVEQKGVATAIEALAQLPAEAELRIVGEGDAGYRDELTRAAARLGLGSRVRFEPPRPREQLAELYRWSDAVVFPVRWDEPWGLVPLEAMALGVPVVATGKGGSGDYLRDRENTLLFEAGDAAGLAGAVTALADSRELRERLRAGGHETAAAHGDGAFNRRAADEILELRRTARG